MSYVIINCPNFGRNNTCSANSLIRQKCQENHTCLLKQINEYCKAVIEHYSKNPNSHSIGRCESAKGVSEFLEVEENKNE